MRIERKMFLTWNWTHVFQLNQRKILEWAGCRGGGGGVPQHISHLGVCPPPPPSGRGFAPFWSENGYTLCPVWSGIGCGFRRNYWSVWTYFTAAEQNRITKLKTKSQNSKQNHKIQNRNTKLKTESQNSKQKYNTQNGNTKLKSEKGTQRTKHRRTLLPHHSSISIKPEKERVIVREKKQILVMRRSLLTFFVPPTFNFPFSYYFCSVVAFIVPTLI